MWRKPVIRLALVIVAAACVSALVRSGAFGAEQAAQAGAVEGLTFKSLLKWSSLWLALASLVCEYIDSTLGMGYGTILSPVLISVFGYDPLMAVPAVLFSELCTGILGGLAHHKAGNVKLTPGERPFAVAMVLVACSVVGAWVAVKMATAIPKWVLKLIIALIVLSMAVVILALRDYRRRFTWRKIAVLGAVASFNKAVSGGGYGPVIVAGQIISGIDSKHAVGITSFAEGLTCIVGVLTYAFTSGDLPWGLAIPMTFGALLSVPFAVISVKLIPAKKFTRIVGFTTLVLGLYSMYKSWPDIMKWMNG